MIFVDTDIFVIDRLFHEDKRHAANKQFLDHARDKSTSVYNLLELCGLASFSLTTTELTTLFTNFHKQYDLTILYPKILKPSPEELIRHSISKIFDKICAKMNYPDAQVLLIAEEHDCSDFVTWNKKHFEGRTYIPIFTPLDYVDKLQA